MENEKDLLEELFQSVDIIVNSKLNSLKYDITELCTIEEVKGDKEYYVSNGSAKYIAYAQEDAKYTKGVSVYVVIPQGDYNNQKLIMGRYTSKDLSSNNWVSPMEDFVNITGNITNNIDKSGLEANGDKYLIQLWTDANNIYTQYDRLCISADFSNDLTEHMVIDGSYGLILTGTKTSVKEEDGKVVEGFEKSNFICVFDSSDMIGNPYDFTAPYNQQKMFIINETDQISNLALYFYQGLNDDGKFTKTFYDINNNLVQSEQENLFIENISVNFGYSFEEYKDETAVLYTLQSKIYKKDEVGQDEKPQRTMRLRWVHYDEDENPHSITDIEDDLLKDHFVKVHWYRYDLQAEVFEDPLAGYFWKEITDNLNKFEYTTDLETNWKEENFKVIIEYDDKIIESEILEFTNPDGQLADKSMIQGLNILFPEDDEYKGKFYVYGDDQTATISTEKTMKLIADYITVESQIEYWESTDVICWKFPAKQTMIHKPEEGFEFFKEQEDVFIEAEVGESAWVNGILFEANPEYHLVIRKININEEGTLDSRSQNYRINSQYVNTYGNNSIKCEVFKPTINSVEAEVNFTFGLYGTNGTKYTLAVSWTEEDLDGNKYQKPPAITWHMNTEKGEMYKDTTKIWYFDVSILDSSHKEIEAPVNTGWNVKLEWVRDITAGTDSNTDKLNDAFTLMNSYDPRNGSKKAYLTTYNGFKYIMNFAQFQVLKVSVENFEYNLTTFIPIAIRSTRDIAALDGPCVVYYDSSGYNPRYNDKYYELVPKPNVELGEAVWGIKYSETEAKTEDNKDNISLQVAWSQLPQLDYRENKPFITNSYLRVPDTYLPPETGYEGVCVHAKIDNNLVWVQPLYITMDAYGSSFFNEWDGSMKIDEDTNTILASVIGAGKKDKQNRYSGVVLGEVDKVVKINSDGTKSVASNAANTGILGFHEGVQSFGLLNDGTATLGKSGRGQIKFNGNKGTIQSANYVESQDGMQIDLDDAKISTPRLWIDGDYKNDNPYFKIADSKDADESYFEVSSTGNVYMGKWSLDNQGQFTGLNNNKYTLMAPPGANNGNWVFAAGATLNSDWTTAPFRVDQDGNLIANNATISGSVNITEGSISIGKNFNVDNNGVLTAKDANITGTITATAGTIGGCTIEDGVLKVGRANIPSINADAIYLNGSRVYWNTIYYVSDVSIQCTSKSWDKAVVDVQLVDGQIQTKRQPINFVNGAYLHIYRRQSTVLGNSYYDSYDSESSTPGYVGTAFGWKDSPRGDI